MKPLIAVLATVSTSLAVGDSQLVENLKAGKPQLVVTYGTSLHECDCTESSENAGGDFCIFRCRKMTEFRGGGADLE